MRVGLLDVTEVAAWGPVFTERRCRKYGHRYTPWRELPFEPTPRMVFVAGMETVVGGMPEWGRRCHNCGWTYVVQPSV